MSSKVYDKPDRNVNLFWECERKMIVSNVYAVFKSGMVSAVLEDGFGMLVDPTQGRFGRWRPYIANNPEPWPPKTLMPRRCWATVKDTGERSLFVRFDDEPSPPDFRMVDIKHRKGWSPWFHEQSLSNIHWIDPEQEAVEVPQ